MAKQKVYITGATGFLGSAVLAKLVTEGYEVLAAKRTTSSLAKCEAVADKVKWVNLDSADYITEVVAFQPDTIFHAAWAGVIAKERADWQLQLQNFTLVKDLLLIAQQTATQKIIVLGSQAEYGTISTKVDETYPADGADAYAACKKAVCGIIKDFCQQKGLDWYWLRIFSVFGPGEEANWFIPWIITNQLNSAESNLTLCEQKYDYLYVTDFAAMIETIIAAEQSASGIYNISSGTPVSLRLVAETIQEKAGYNAVLNFGAVPYRAGQSMCIAGDNIKFRSTFGEIALLDLPDGLQRTIQYYKER